jgi:hypothetical protein
VLVISQLATFIVACRHSSQRIVILLLSDWVVQLGERDNWLIDDGHLLEEEVRVAAGEWGDIFVLLAHKA